MIPANTILTAYLAREYKTLLLNAVIDKINYSKIKKTFNFHFHTPKQRYQLLFSFSPPEFILLNDTIESNDSIEIWREIEDSTITDVSSVEDNRVIKFSLSRQGIDSHSNSFEIVFELFGSQCNAYLLGENQIILQAVRVLKTRLNLKAKDKYSYPQLLKNNNRSNSLEILKSENYQFDLQIKENSYTIAVTPNPPSDLIISQTTPLVSLYQWCFLNQVQKLRYSNSQENYIKILTRRLNKANKGISDLQKRLIKCKDADKYQNWADILMSNPRVKTPDEKVVLNDYQSNSEIEIPIISEKTIIQNAEEYYKQARKLRKAPPKINEQLGILEKRSTEIVNQINEIKSLTSVIEIEKIAEKYEITPKKKKSEVKLDALHKYCRVFYTSSGEKVLVGKSNKANDELTFKIARSYDIWLHTQQAPGSHVILVVADKNKPPSQQAVLEAAEIAAHFSSMRKSSNVPIIYTKRGNVRKVRKGLPGQVIPQQVKSIFVDPRKPKDHSK